jgi:O-antigen/teichoic acid export membrane protein
MALQRAVSSVTLADLSNKPAHEIEIYIHRAFRALLWILAAICVAGFVFGGVLLRWIFGTHFDAAVPIFHILLVDAALTCIGQLLIEAFLASGKPSYPSTVQVASLGITTVALVALAPSFGGEGAAVAMVCGSTLRLVTLLVGLRRIHLRMPNPIPDGHDVKALLAILRTHDAQASAPSSRT